MYELVRAIIDDILMAPAVAPFTTFGLIILIVLAVAGIFGDAPDTEAAE